VSFHVLVVCTGNICRSPMAEHLLRAGLAARGVDGIEVSSAGTHGLVGEPVHEHAAAVLAARAIDATGFCARRLDAELVAGADLVLGASREHRAAAVTLVPRAAARSFTVRELDRLLSAVDIRDLPRDAADRARVLVTAAAGQRGLVRPERPGDDDITDPYGGPAAGYAPTARLIDAALQRFVDLLGGPGGEG
jgi:protein-tyrosine phosphatase